MRTRDEIRDALHCLEKERVEILTEAFIDLLNDVGADRDGFLLEILYEALMEHTS